VLAAHIGRLRSGFLLPMICSSVKRLGFMSIPQRVMDSTHFWSRSRGSGQGPNDAIRAMAARRNSVQSVPGPAKNWLRGRGPRQTTIGLGLDHFVTVITSVEATGAVRSFDRTADEP
jgi:hypothetical protein